MMKITCKEKTGEFPAPITVQDALSALLPGAQPKALGCFCGGRALELNEKITKDCSIFPITFQNEEGRRIYERSLRFVLLLAVKRVLPGVHLRIEHSIGYGVYMRLLERISGRQDEHTAHGCNAYTFHSRTRHSAACHKRPDNLHTR